MLHPTPWKVVYAGLKSQGWHKKSMPYILDANKDRVLRVPQYANHPGNYDKEANELSHRIVNAINEIENSNL